MIILLEKDEPVGHPVTWMGRASPAGARMEDIE